MEGKAEISVSLGRRGHPQIFGGGPVTSLSSRFSARTCERLGSGPLKFSQRLERSSMAPGSSWATTARLCVCNQSGLRKLGGCSLTGSVTHRIDWRGCPSRSPRRQLTTENFALNGEAHGVGLC